MLLFERAYHYYYCYSVRSISVQRFRWLHHQTVLNKTCPSRGCRSPHSGFFFFIPQGSFLAITMQSHPFHLSAALAPVIMAPPGRAQAASPLHIRTSSPLFLPVPLQRCRLPLVAVGSLSAISSHQRWCNKGDTWRNIRLIAVATATEKTWEMY